ncbi:MAG: hypothetical protein DI606_13970 [Sphingobium sp.]|uniref:DUF983 domain-containing protein n=1 Tax=Sphingobium sp. TaxID=1912891 RepID=UPI000DB3A460|nr:DUF983 domain-containing protein [Sphingobium sp.]PZU09363.1 MAG: hypothetical protein DI606_13970 [Sphingobium sp.]
MTDPAPVDRPLWPAVVQGLRGRCPACGEGRMFARFLKVAPACPHCGERLDLHQADDFPAYIVILALGHILVPLMIEVNAAFAIPLGWQAAIWPTLAVILATAMIQPVKGAVVALQWSRRMAGFA